MRPHPEPAAAGPPACPGCRCVCSCCWAGGGGASCGPYAPHGTNHHHHHHHKDHLLHHLPLLLLPCCCQRLLLLLLLLPGACWVCVWAAQLAGLVGGSCGSSTHVIATAATARWFATATTAATAMNGQQDAAHSKEELGTAHAYSRVAFKTHNLTHRPLLIWKH